MLDITIFIERINIILDYYKLSHSNFAKRINVPRSSISHIMSGRNKPSLDFILKIIKSFKDVELSWLIQGIGNFPKESTSTAESPNLFKQEGLKKNPENLLKEKEEEILKLEKIAKDDTEKKNTKIVEQIIIFYMDGSFKIYR